MKAAAAVAEMSAMVDKLPTAERQVRELLRHDHEDRGRLMRHDTITITAAVQLGYLPAGRHRWPRETPGRPPQRPCTACGSRTDWGRHEGGGWQCDACVRARVARDQATTAALREQRPSRGAQDRPPAAPPG